MASSSQSLPVSVLLKTKSQDGELQKKTREDWRKAKELEEARKAGTAPAAVDEEGRDINPHIPQYISAAPWYYNTEGPTLKHQRPQEKGTKIASMQEWFHRGVNLESVSLKFRKGACENCGAITHKRKDCMERPRKIGAKFSGESIAPDEFVQPKFELDFDSKRDRWNGYDPAEHTAIIEEFQKVEETKRAVKAQKLNTGEADGEVDDDEEEDEDKYVDEVDMPGTKVDSKQRITVRNLRIREDTAKYLRNLDPNSAYYDPKTRSMRDNPYKNTGKTDGDVDFAGENFIRYSGDTVKHAQAQLFAWEAHTVGVDVHLLAEPTKAEKLQKEYSHKKEEIKGKVQDSILEKYGGREHLEAPPRSLLLAQTEDYVEYSRQGKVIKGAEKPVIRSQYEEDILINNHTTVWGSYWKDGHWGYQCCHSFIKNSYCTGDSGKSEAKPPPPPLAVMPPKPSTSAAVKIESSGEGSAKEEVKEKEEKRKEKKDKKKKKKKSQKRKRRHSSSSSSSDSEDEQDEKIKKLKAALALEEKRTKEAEKLLAMDERKRPYNSMTEVQAPTEEEMEAYYLKRKREEDPMASFF